MNKAELVKQIAAEHNVSIALSNRILNSIVDRISANLKSGRRVAIPRLGAFSIVRRKSRTMVTPGGNKVTVQAHSAPRFKASSALKSAVADSRKK